MRVALVELYGIGGTADYTACLAEALGSSGAVVKVVTSALFEPLSEPPAFDVARAFCYRTEHRKPLKAVLLALALRRIRAILETWKPDVIHVQGTVIPSLEKQLYSVLSGTPLVCTAHDVRSHERRPWLGSLGRFYGVFDWLICHSRASMEQLRCLGLQAPISVIPHGIYDRLTTSGPGRAEARGRLGLGINDHVVLLFGYLRRYKGLDDLLAAVRLARELGTPLKLVVAGRPLYDVSAAVRRARAWELDVVWHLEYVPRQDVVTYFEAADVVALPYVDTSDSGALELAAAYEKPIVVTSTGGLVEAFARHGLGAVVPPRDPEALATALAGHHHRQTGVSGKNSWTDVATATHDLYDRVLRARGTVANAVRTPRS